MKVIFFILLSLSIQSCTTLMIAVNDNGREECLQSRQYTVKNYRVKLGEEFYGYYSLEPKNLSLPELEKLYAIMNDPEKTTYIGKLGSCYDPEIKEMPLKHDRFVASVKDALDSARKTASIKEKETLELSAKKFEEECSMKEKFAKKRGLKVNCEGFPLSGLVYGIIKNEVTESEMKKYIVSLTGSYWAEEQAFQALDDRALFMAEHGRFVIMIKGRGIIQGQTLSALGQEFVFQGITQYQSNFGPRQAFVFTVLDR